MPLLCRAQWWPLSCQVLHISLLLARSESNLEGIHCVPTWQWLCRGAPLQFPQGRAGRLPDQGHQVEVSAVVALLYRLPFSQMLGRICSFSSSSWTIYPHLSARDSGFPCCAHGAFCFDILASWRQGCQACYLCNPGRRPQG